MNKLIGNYCDTYDCFTFKSIFIYYEEGVVRGLSLFFTNFKRPRHQTKKREQWHNTYPRFPIRRDLHVTYSMGLIVDRRS